MTETIKLLAKMWLIYFSGDRLIASALLRVVPKFNTVFGREFRRVWKSYTITKNKKTVPLNLKNTLNIFDSCQCWKLHLHFKLTDESIKAKSM